MISVTNMEECIMVEYSRTVSRVSMLYGGEW
jgi:hypothetical protein